MRSVALPQDIKVDESGHEHAAGTGLGVGGGALQELAETFRLGRAAPKYTSHRALMNNCSD